MRKSVLKIGSFEIDDAQISPQQTKGENTLSIPCKSDPDLCTQLDGWDDHTSVPALLDGKQTLLYKKHYDRHQDAWVMRMT
ncbi:hypothetical protein PL78_18870 [Yersinia entomophaga]|uniref:DUF1480 family protein n=1 Tax=Yersinia entomophaga TaxID=935293 RepID=A0ABM6BQX4_YERET|nr:DUF1480 family protein [Yersinia entomophaga]ANI31875.1 hypothetical protein PL78_18870 [Yersinia entomophaga]OWF86742.1 hypothetical protein B4914_14290 [Yersinia entomophaga]